MHFGGSRNYLLLFLLRHLQVISGSAGTTLYAPITSLKAAPGSRVTAGSVLGQTTAAGYLYFTYAPKGDAFAMSTAVDPNPCFCKYLVVARRAQGLSAFALKQLVESLSHKLLRHNFLRVD